MAFRIMNVFLRNTIKALSDLLALATVLVFRKSLDSVFLRECSYFQ